MRKLATFIVTLILTNLAFAQLPPPKSMLYGAKTIDGDLSDWAGADWLTLGAGNPDGGATWGAATDLTNAKYSCTWDESGFYVAVQLTDTVPTYESLNNGYFPTWWNSTDQIEVYVDSANTNYAYYSYGGSSGFSFADAQQYIISPDPCGLVGSTWAILGWMNTATLARAGVITPIMALATEGYTLTYEVHCPAQQPAGTALPLSLGMTVGLDVTAMSNDGTTYSLLSANDAIGKWYYAGEFQDWILAPEPLTITLLSLGGLALLRRKG